MCIASHMGIEAIICGFKMFYYLYNCLIIQLSMDTKATMRLDKYIHTHICWNVNLCIFCQSMNSYLCVPVLYLCIYIRVCYNIGYMYVKVVYTWTCIVIYANAHGLMCSNIDLYMCTCVILWVLTCEYGLCCRHGVKKPPINQINLL